MYSEVLVSVAPDDIMLSLDIVSLYTKVPLNDIIDLLLPLFSETVVQLFDCVLRSTYFVYQGVFYEQVEGVPMGSPLSPRVVDLHMEAFEAKALEQAALKPLLYCYYIDDSLLFWQHGQEELEKFVTGLNKVCVSIQFTNE